MIQNGFLFKGVYLLLMILKEYFMIDLREWVIAALVFIVSFTSVFVSRESRLSSSGSVSSADTVSLYLHTKTDIDELLSKLTEQGVHLDEKEALWAARLLGWRTFRKGHYSLSGDYSYDQLFTKFALGNQDPVSVTVLPGINQSRFSRNLSLIMHFDSSEVESVFEDSVFLAKAGFNKEELFGRMLPETYSIYWTSSPEAVVTRILEEFERKVTDQYAERLKEDNLTVDDIVTMASIVEWEAAFEEEKPRISGLYWNRLKRGMLLQADPTVNYAIGERRRLLFEDYAFEHPFNTYLNKGLPPAPITNPSLSSIEATINPEEHDFLYMVANPERGHIFTRTFAEHQVESEKWRRWLRQQYRIKRQREAAEAAQSNSSN